MLPIVAALFNLLEHKRVDVDHMVLQHVQRKHANLVILTTIAENTKSVAPSVVETLILVYPQSVRKKDRPDKGSWVPGSQYFTGIRWRI